MQKKRKHAGKAQPGHGEAAGVSFDPKGLPEEEAPATKKAVPQGLPISQEEYEKLQKQARHVKLPHTGSAQEDTAE